MNKKNRGTGAGGSKTNKHGLDFEKEIYLKKWLAKEYKLKNISKSKTDFFEIYQKNKLIGYYGRQGQIYNCLELLIKHVDKDFINKIFSKKINPDSFILNIKKQHITIFEKKWQQMSGSVDEKLQTAPFKLKMFNRLLKSTRYSISYEYVLSEWFKNPIYRNIWEYYKNNKNVKIWTENDNLKDLDIKKYFE